MNFSKSGVDYSPWNVIQRERIMQRLKIDLMEFGQR